MKCLYLYMPEFWWLVSCLSGLWPQQQWSRRTTVGRDSRTEREAGREGEMPGGNCKGPHQFTVCLITLQLLLYSDTCFLLFDDGMIWIHAYVITTDVSMVTGNCGIFMLNTDIFKHLSIKQIIAIAICGVLKNWIDGLLCSVDIKISTYIGSP